MLINKHRLLFLFLLLAFLLMLSACGSRKTEPEATTFELNKDGSVSQTIKGQMAEDMTEDGLNGYITELLTAYNAEKEEPAVVLDSLEVSGNKNVTIRMTYSSINDYSAFNREDAYIGTVESAYREGYRFTRSFQTAAGSRLSGYTLPVEYPGMTVLVLKEAMNVILPEKAILVSDDITRNDDGSFTIGRSVKSNIPEVFQTVNENCSYILYNASVTEEKQ